MEDLLADVGQMWLAGADAGSRASPPRVPPQTPLMERSHLLARRRLRSRIQRVPVETRLRQRRLVYGARCSVAEDNNRPGERVSVQEGGSIIRRNDQNVEQKGAVSTGLVTRNVVSLGCKRVVVMVKVEKSEHTP